MTWARASGSDAISFRTVSRGSAARHQAGPLDGRELGGELGADVAALAEPAEEPAGVPDRQAHRAEAEVPERRDPRLEFGRAELAHGAVPVEGDEALEVVPQRPRGRLGDLAPGQPLPHVAVLELAERRPAAHRVVGHR
jgi:hypothetical protein